MISMKKPYCCCHRRPELQLKFIPIDCINFESYEKLSKFRSQLSKCFSQLSKLMQMARMNFKISSYPVLMCVGEGKRLLCTQECHTSLFRNVTFNSIAKYLLKFFLLGAKSFCVSVHRLACTNSSNSCPSVSLKILISLLCLHLAYCSAYSYVL